MVTSEIFKILKVCNPAKIKTKIKNEAENSEPDVQRLARRN